MCFNIVLNETIIVLKVFTVKLEQENNLSRYKIEAHKIRYFHYTCLDLEGTNIVAFVHLQLKTIADRVPSEAADSLKALQNHSEIFLSGQGIHPPDITSASEHARAHQRSASMGNLLLAQDGSSGNASSSVASLTGESPCHRIMENSLRANGDFAPKHGTHGEVQLIEQFEPGVYVTLIQLRDGTKVFKRVRFR